MADYIRTWFIIFMQPLCGMSITHRNKGLQARVKLHTRNAQEWFLLLLGHSSSHKKIPNFPEDTGRRASALPTCPSSDPGSGPGPCGRSRGSDPAGWSPSGTGPPAPAASPRASTGHLACTHGHISSNPRTISAFLLSQTSFNPIIKNLRVLSRSCISVSEKIWFMKTSLISARADMRREWVSFPLPSGADRHSYYSWSLLFGKLE